MNINSISSMNFGLTKSENYRKFEQDWISNIKNPQKRKEAENIANAINKRVPGGFLDIDENGKDFLIYPNGENQSPSRYIGKIYFNKPHITTLLKLNNALKNLKTI